MFKNLRGRNIDEVSPTSIDEINTLFGDMSVEMYYGMNFRHGLMNCSDEFIHTLKQFIEQCRNDRMALGTSESLDEKVYHEHEDTNS